MSWDSHWPTSQASPDPSGWHPSLLFCQLHLSALCHLQTCLRCTDITVCVIEEDTEEQQSPHRFLRDTTQHLSMPGDRALSHNSLALSFQPIPYPLSSRPFKSACLQFRDGDVMRDCVADLVEVYVDDIGQFSFVKCFSHSILEDDQIGQTRFVHAEAIHFYTSVSCVPVRFICKELFYIWFPKRNGCYKWNYSLFQTSH